MFCIRRKFCFGTFWYSVGYKTNRLILGACLYSPSFGVKKTKKVFCRGRPDSLFSTPHIKNGQNGKLTGALWSQDDLEDNKSSFLFFSIFKSLGFRDTHPPAGAGGGPFWLRRIFDKWCMLSQSPGTSGSAIIISRRCRFCFVNTIYICHTVIHGRDCK